MPACCWDGPQRESPPVSERARRGFGVCVRDSLQGGAAGGRTSGGAQHARGRVTRSGIGGPRARLYRWGRCASCRSDRSASRLRSGRLDPSRRGSVPRTTGTHSATEMAMAGLRERSPGRPLPPSARASSTHPRPPRPTCRRLSFVSLWFLPTVRTSTSNVGPKPDVLAGPAARPARSLDWRTRPGPYARAPLGRGRRHTAPTLKKPLGRPRIPPSRNVVDVSPPLHPPLARSRPRLAARWPPKSTPPVSAPSAWKSAAAPTSPTRTCSGCTTRSPRSWRWTGSLGDAGGVGA